MMQTKHLFAILAFSAIHKLSMNRIWFWQICSIFKIVRTYSRLCLVCKLFVFSTGVYSAVCRVPSSAAAWRSRRSYDREKRNQTSSHSWAPV